MEKTLDVRSLSKEEVQGCQMVNFQTQNPNLYWKLFTNCMAIWNVLRTFGIF
jgi:hypothetical protein